MPRTEDPYSRVYWRAVDDPRFEHVWNDDHALAWWLRLLIAADQSWPASAALPQVHRGGLKLLTESGLIEVTGYRFRIHGLDVERQRRANAGRTGGVASWNARSTTVERPFNGSATAVEPSQAKTRQEETRRESRATNGELSERQKVGDAMRDASGLHFPMDSRNGDRLGVMVKRDGVDRVLDTIRQAAEDMGGYPDQSALVNTVANYLNTPLSGKRETPAQREEREMRERQSKLNAEAAARRAPQGVA